MAEQQSPGARPPRTFSNALATLAGRGLGQLARLAAVFVMMAHLSPESWGLLAVLLSGLDVARGFTNFGMDVAATRQMALHPEAESRILKHVLGLKTGFALLGMLALGAYSWNTVGSFAAPVAILPLALLPLGWTNSLAARFQVRHAMHWLIPVQGAAGGLYLLAVYLAGRAGAQLTGFVVLVVGVEALTCAAAAFVGHRVWKGAEPDQTVDVLRPVLRDGLPLGLLEIVVILHLRLGIFLVKSRGGGDVEAGHLYAAIRINDYTVAFAGALAASALPIFARLVRQKNPKEIIRTFAKYSLLCIGFSSAVAVALTLFGANILALKNPGAVAAAAPLAILTWAGVAMSQNNLSGSVLYAFGHFRRVAGWACVSVLLYYVIGSELVPRYHASGAAMTTVITETTAAFAYLTFAVLTLRRHLRAMASAPAADAQLDPGFKPI